MPVELDSPEIVEPVVESEVESEPVVESESKLVAPFEDELPISLLVEEVAVGSTAPVSEGVESHARPRHPTSVEVRMRVFNMMVRRIRRHRQQRLPIVG